MNKEEFLQTIRTKYPVYDTVADDVLYAKIIDKYPVYKDRIIDEQPTAPADKDGLVADIKSRVDKGSDALLASKRGEQSVASGIYQTVAQGAGAVGDVALAGLKTITPKPIEELAAKGIEKVGGAIAETQTAQSLAEKYAQFKAEHPEAAANLEATGLLSTILPVGKGAQLATKGVVKAAEKGVEGVTSISKLSGKLLDERRTKNIETSKAKVDETVGRIIQGKTTDIKQAKRALSDVDTTGVKTYKELGERMDDQAEVLSRRLDEFLDEEDAVKGPIKGSQFTTETKVGKTVVKQNFVRSAMTQLQELYTVTKDATARAKIGNLQTKLKAEGLTRREVNELAREYGREFGSKAFNPRSGEPITSVSAQAYENTRKGLKDAFRSKIESDIPKELDSRVSDLIETGRLTGKMEERVNALWQKAKKRGLFERVANKLGTAIDVASLHTISGFVSRLLPSNVGLKTMNAIDIEEELVKNLKQLDALLSKANDDEVVAGIAEIMRKTEIPTVEY